MLGPTLVVGGMLPMMDVLINAGLVFLLSLRYKTAICYMFAIGISTALLIMQFFPGVKYLVPAYVGGLLTYSMISPIIVAILCLVYMAFVGVCLVLAANKFERLDLK